MYIYTIYIIYIYKCALYIYTSSLNVFIIRIIKADEWKKQIFTFSLFIKTNFNIAINIDPSKRNFWCRLCNYMSVVYNLCSTFC